MSSLRRTATLALVGVVVPALALAQQPARTPRDTAPRPAARRDSTRIPRLAPVVTTASRYEADARALPRRVDVVSRRDLENTPAMDVADLLKKRTAIDIVQYPSILAGIGIRGFRPTVGSINQRNVILMDGRPAGVTNLGMLDLAEVERIEVLKGAASALYGSTAMGGVVNIVTRRRTGARGGEVTVAGGSFGASDLRIALGGRLGFGLDADASFRRFDQRDDFRLGDGNAFRTALAGGRAEKIYPLGNRPNRFVADTIGDGIVRTFTSQATTSGSLRVGGAFAGDWRADVRVEGFDGSDVPSPGDIYQAASPSPGNGRKDVSRLGTSLEVGRSGGAIRPLLRAWRVREQQGFYNRPDSVRFVNFDGVVESDGLQLQAAVARGVVSVVAGADLVRQTATSERFSAPGVGIAPFSPDARVTSTAAFVEARIADVDERLVATLGARADRVGLSLRATPFRPDLTPATDHFTAFNPNVGLRWRATRGLVLHGTAGTGFAAPDAFGRAGRSTQVSAGTARITIGNANLGPERSATIDLGAGWARADGAFELDVTGFATSIQDRILAARATFAAGTRPTLADGTPVSQVDTRVNAGTASLRGVEWTLRWDPLRARGSTRSLSLFTTGTRILEASERSPIVTVDGTPFRNQPNFDPARVFSAVALGTSSTAYVRNVADVTVTGGIEYDDRRRWRAGLTGRYVGQRYDQDFSDFSDVSDIRYPDMLTLDLVAGVRVHRTLRLDLLVNNLTDENVYEKRGFNLMGRALQLRVTSAF